MVATYWMLAIGHLRLKDLKKNQNPYKSKISKANNRKRILCHHSYSHKKQDQEPEMEV